MPSASNLALGELAINIADGKLYYNSGGTVQLIAANLLPIANGGTFSTSIPTAGAISYGNGSSYQFTAVGTTGQLLTSAGAGVPTWSNIADIAVTSLSFGTTGLTPATATQGAITVAGTLAIGSGGTNTTATPTAYGVAYGTGTAYAFTAAGTAKQVLSANISAAPTWTTLTSGTSILYGDGSGGFSNVTIGTGVSFAGGTLSATGTGGTVTSVTGTSPVVSSGGTTPAISLASGYGDTLNPYAAKTANYVLAGPTTGAATVPAFRALVAADIPTAALSKTDDTNVTLTLGGSPTTALVNAASLTLGWSGQLAVGRGGTGLSAGISGGIPYFSSTSAMTSSALLTQYGVIYGGGAGASPVATAAGTTGQILTATTGGAPTWSSTYAGTVTSVSFTGGIITVATASTTPALTVAGTSGGIPYFSSATTWATSAALAANAIVLGGGAGAAPATTTTGTGVVTALGVNTGTAGAFVVNGGVLGTPSSGTVTNLTGTASININGTVGATTANTGAFTTVSATGVITSTVATGTAPFTVASTTQVANLNAATAGTAAALSATLAATSGGTGQSSYAVGDLLYASTTTALSKLADVATGNALISGGVSTAPSWGKIGLTTHVSGTLPVANGGTNLTSFTANGIMYASSTSALATGSALTFDGTNFLTTGKATASAFTVTANTNPVNGINLYGTNSLGLFTNSAVSVFINASQQIGILNQNPQVALDVGVATVSGLATYGGLIRITGYNTAATAAQGLEFQGRSDVAGYGNRISHRSNNGDLVFEGRANSATWTELVRMFPSGGVSIGNTTDPGATNLSVSGTVRTQGYTVATLPAAGTAGRKAYVTNALAPAFGSAVVGGGAVVIPVFDNGTTWIVG